MRANLPSRKTLCQRPTKSELNLGLLLIIAPLLLAVAGCVEFKEPVADQTHFTLDDRILGKWEDASRTKDRTNWEVRTVDAQTGLYELILEKGLATPFRLLDINGSLIMSYSRATTPGQPPNADTAKQTNVALCQFDSDGKLRIFDLNQQTTGQVISAKQLPGTFERSRFGRYSKVTVNSADSTRAWIKTFGRSLFERDPYMTLTRRD